MIRNGQGMIRPGYVRGLRVAGAGLLKGFKALLVRRLVLLLLVVRLGTKTSPVVLAILLEPVLPSFLIEPKKDLLLVTVSEDMLVGRWLHEAEPTYNSVPAMT